MGRILRQLEADGLAERTIVVFTSDHGEAHVRASSFATEEGLHVPLIVRRPPSFPVPAPAHYRAGTVDDRLIAAIDLLPTLLDVAAGRRNRPGCKGKSSWAPRAEAPRTYVFGARDRCDETVFRFRTVRDARYRYIRNFTLERPFLRTNNYKERSYPVWNLIKELNAQGKLTPAQAVLAAPSMPPEEFYDLERDPHEIQNLVDSSDPAHQSAAQATPLRARTLDRRIKRSRPNSRTGRGLRGRGSHQARGGQKARKKKAAN